MKCSRKLLLWTTVIIGMIVVAHTVRQRIFRNKLATTIARARYATFTCDAFSLEKKPVSREVASMISEKIRNESSFLFLGRKSVVYGHIDLFDEESVPIAELQVFTYPLFGWGRKQFESRFDIAKAYGFDMDEISLRMAKEHEREQKKIYKNRERYEQTASDFLRGVNRIRNGLRFLASEQDAWGRKFQIETNASSIVYTSHGADVKDTCDDIKLKIERDTGAYTISYEYDSCRYDTAGFVETEKPLPHGIIPMNILKQVDAQKTERK